MTAQAALVALVAFLEDAGLAHSILSTSQNQSDRLCRGANLTLTILIVRLQSDPGYYMGAFEREHIGWEG